MGGLGIATEDQELVTDSKSAESTTPQRMSWWAQVYAPTRDQEHGRHGGHGAHDAPYRDGPDPERREGPEEQHRGGTALAPEETPRRNGSARALRTMTCTTVPAVVSAAPTTAASSTRGRRICQTISSATVFLG